jgi:hypothetical protein
MGSELLSSASAVAGVVGLAVSIAACLVAWRSAVYSQRGAVAAERSAGAAVRSAEAAVAALQRDIEEAQRASILMDVTWAGPGGPTLHVRNDGPSPAYNLDFIIRPVKPQKKSPKISSSAELPLKELPPRGYIKFYTEKWSFWNPLCDVTVTFSDGNGPQQRTERLGV